MVLVVFLFYPLLIDALLEKHYLEYKFTALSKASSLAEFSAEGVADDRQISHYSDEEKDWILTEEGQTKAPPGPADSREWFIHQMKILSNCTDSQCSEDHIFQRITGCELEKHLNGSVKSLTVFDEYGFDGEDFIAFDSDTKKWIEKNPKAKETKKRWDLQTGRNTFISYFLKNCVDWISTFNNTNQRQPNVHVSARKDPSDHYELVLSCLATGFYPRDIQMYIRNKYDDYEYHYNYDNIISVDQESSGIRPNGDGSFQMRISVEIDRNPEERYVCVVTHNSLKHEIRVQWDGQCIDCVMDYSWIYIGGVIAAVVLLVFFTLCGWCIYKKKKNRTMRAYNSDDGSDRYRL